MHLLQNVPHRAHLITPSAGVKNSKNSPEITVAWLDQTREKGTRDYFAEVEPHPFPTSVIRPVAHNTIKKTNPVILAFLFFKSGRYSSAAENAQTNPANPNARAPRGTYALPADPRSRRPKVIPPAIPSAVPAADWTTTCIDSGIPLRSR